MWQDTWLKRIMQSGIRMGYLLARCQPRRAR